MGTRNVNDCPSEKRKGSSDPFSSHSFGPKPKRYIAAQAAPKSLKSVKIVLVALLFQFFFANGSSAPATHTPSTSQR